MQPTIESSDTASDDVGKECRAGRSDGLTNAHASAVERHSHNRDLHEQTLNRIEREMLRVRETFAPIFKWVICSVVAIIAVTVVTILVVTIVPIFNSEARLDTIIIVRLIQVSFGMILGTACVFFGVVLSWLGITGNLIMGAEGNTPGVKGGFQLASTSPGIVLILVGAVLIGVSLYRPVRYEESTEYPGALIQRPDEGNY